MVMVKTKILTFSVITIIIPALLSCASSLEGKKCPSVILVGGFYNKFEVTYGAARYVIDFGKADGKVKYKILDKGKYFLISGGFYDSGRSWFVNKPNKDYFFGPIATVIMNNDFIVVKQIISGDWVGGYYSEEEDAVKKIVRKTAVENNKFEIKIMKQHVDISEFKYISFGITPAYYGKFE
jgi:hypothetical protein